MNSKRKFVAHAALVGILLTVGACGSGPVVAQADGAPIGPNPGSSTPSSPAPIPSPGSIKSTGPDAETLDKPDMGLGPFLEQFRLSPTAEGLPSPTSIDSAIEDSTVVLIAKVDGVIDEGKYATEAGSSDSIQQAGIVLRPIKVLRGELQPGLDKVIIQQWDSPSGVKSMAAAAVPAGVGIFFLRWAGAYPHPDVPYDEPTEYERAHYIWTHFNTVYVQGDEHAFAPMASVDDASARHGMTNAAEGAAYAKLSGLAERIRSSESDTEKVASPN